MSSRKPVAPVPSQEGVSNRAPGEAASGPSTDRPTGLAKQFFSIDVACSYCGAEPGQRCHDRGSDKPSDISHNSRAEKAEKATVHWRAWHGDKAANAELPLV